MGPCVSAWVLDWFMANWFWLSAPPPPTHTHTHSENRSYAFVPCSTLTPISTVYTCQQ